MFRIGIKTSVKSLLLLHVGIVLLCWFGAVTETFAQDDAAKNTPATDVRLVIDVSGSMKRNDPNNLRQPAVELLVELLPEDSTAGVWTFGKWVNMLIPHKPVDEQWRERARRDADKINSVGLFTNIGGALEKAAYDMGYVDQAAKKHIILLTDGMVDIDKQPAANKVEWRRIVDEVLPKLKAAGYVVHTIALSNNADRDLMNRLSVSTDGVADTAQSAEDLMKIFLKAFDAAVPSEQVALTDNQFVIDSSVEEFTALIFRKNSAEQIALISPDNQRWTSTTKHPELRWHRTAAYDLITVKQPLEGSWGVQGEMEPESRISVVANLNMRVKPLPNNVLLGDMLNVEALLQEDGKTITDPAFLKLMSVQAELFGGNSFDALVSLWSEPMSRANRAEGRYSVALPELDREGVYLVKVKVDGKTFTREFKHQITLRQTFSAEIREQFKDGQLLYVLTVNAHQDDIDYEATRIVATIATPTGGQLVKNLALTELDAWQAELSPDAEGVYRARVQVKGKSTSGSRFSYSLDELTFNYSADGGMVEAVEPFVEPVVEATATPEPEATATPKPKVVPSAKVEDDTEALAEQQGVADWILYTALGVGNLLLVGIGAFVFRRIMKGPKQDEVIAELDQAPEEAEQEDAGSSDEAETEDADDDEEEPPMEDLDPDVTEEADADLSMGFDSTEDEGADDDDSDVDDLLSGLDDEPSMSMDDEPESTEPDADTDGLDDIDDIDAMAMEIAEEAASTAATTEPEDDDMVSAMLKAQGLDLAEEELDDAISSLIDDLEDDDDEPV